MGAILYFADGTEDLIIVEERNDNDPQLVIVEE